MALDEKDLAQISELIATSISGYSKKQKKKKKNKKVSSSEGNISPQAELKSLMEQMLSDSKAQMSEDSFNGEISRAKEIDGVADMLSEKDQFTGATRLQSIAAMPEKKRRKALNKIKRQAKLSNLPDGRSPKITGRKELKLVKQNEAVYDDLSSQLDKKKISDSQYQTEMFDAIAKELQSLTN